MTRIKKYVAAAAIAAAVIGAPTMAQAFASPTKATVAAASNAGAPTSAKAAKTASSVRVVAPGERVQAAPKVQLWLTKDGKHWSTPIQANQFRSVVDGNLDMSQPGVSLQSEPVEGRYFLSGVYHGKGDAASVKVVTDKGTVTGRIIHLAGQPGWGAWYATSALPTGPKSKDFKHNFVHSVTVQDTAGHTIATLTLP
ncbi:hypothetical protein ACFWC5_34880 [Streptomyces sp. NPDC060085]|uniref:hypothetical protein n=1 Tax=Streptomyces sp. NPDC060085 TaxID=3347054 RepID=UPI0036632C85